MAKYDEKKFQQILTRAQDRFKRASDWESYARRLFIEDIRFANADATNKYQWPANIWNDRVADDRPALTINKTRQHNLNIINDAKQNKPAIKFRAAGNGATAEAARMWDGIARHIEYQSNATAHYDVATRFQVEGGIGYLRVYTKYADNQSFNQEIYITSIPDPLTVYLDPDARAPAKEDSRFGFIFEDLAKEVFEQKYPKYKAYSGAESLFGDSAWIDSEHVRVAEYFEAEDKEDELLMFTAPNGETTIILRSDLEKIDPGSEYIKSAMTKRRAVSKRNIHYHFIVGNHIVAEEEIMWPGDCIPIIPVIGEEVIIDNRMDRKGHTRALIDPQRMYNYWASAAVEYGALQTKTPWIVGLESVEGLEEYWARANNRNAAYLPYKSIGGNGEPLAPPTRVEPPVPSPVALKGMEVANLEMQMVSGQYENQMGMQGNERTGKAIAERQRQGDRATYHFIDNLAIAVRQVGKIVLDLVPKIYDTDRVIAILAENNESLEVKLDPQLQQAHQLEMDENNQVVGRILNPNVGTYEVMADVGPGYATRREEAFNALTLILTQNPALAGVIGDIMFRAGDFPMAEEAAERLKRMVPPQALGQGPSQNEQMLMEQIGRLKEALQISLDKLAVKENEAKARFEKREVDVYNAITKRLDTLLKNSGLSTPQTEVVADEAVRESQDVPISDTYEDHDRQNGLQDHEMPPGAQRGEDGHVYAPHPQIPGMVARVTKEQ